MRDLLAGSQMPATDGQVRLTVIVVTYNGEPMVRRCLQSLRDNADEVDELRVKVVDNDSRDSTADMIAREFPEVELIRSATNDGFAVANNKALRTLDTDYCLLLNPDTLILPGVLRHCIEQLALDTSIGLYSCRLETADGTFDHASKREIPDVRSALQYFTRGLRWRTQVSQYTAPNVAEPDFAEVGAINGAYMLSTRAAIARVGLLDESFWMYGEDLDWCVRFRDAGYRVMYDGRVTAVHLKGGSTGRARSPRLNWHFHRSMWIFYRNHQASALAIVNVVVWSGIHVRLVVKTLADMVRRAVPARHRTTH